MPRLVRVPRNVSRCSSAAAGRTVHVHLASPRGFTLVELLMVIAIIGILVGMGVVGINAGAKAIQKRAIALEVAAISQAVEAYKMKYGDYPPDGTSRAAFEAHFRKAFPNIAASEFTAVYLSANSLADAMLTMPPARQTVMDPAEALVFCLGGFSNNPQKPFTGPGGPLAQITGNFNPPIFQYNTERSSGFFEFTQDKLSLILSQDTEFTNRPPSHSGAPPYTLSSDEESLQVSNARNDILPVYRPRGRTAPLVYFAASTYANAGYMSPTTGAARPYKSEQVNTTVNFVQATADKYYKYMNDKSFQIVSAGLDDAFGGVAAPQFYTFPSGKLINIFQVDQQDRPNALDLPLASGYQNPDPSNAGPSPQLDNVTNFSEGPLEDSLP